MGCGGSTVDEYAPWDLYPIVADATKPRVVIVFAEPGSGFAKHHLAFLQKHFQLYLIQDKTLSIDAINAEIKSKWNAGHKNCLIDGAILTEQGKQDQFEKIIVPEVDWAFVLCFEVSDESVRLNRLSKKQDKAQVEEAMKTYRNTCKPCIDKFVPLGLVRRIDTSRKGFDTPEDTFKLVSRILSPSIAHKKEVFFVLGGPGSGKGNSIIHYLIIIIEFIQLIHSHHRINTLHHFHF